jgi:cell wall-associated NlpC family hydrolase
VADEITSQRAPAPRILDKRVNTPVGSAPVLPIAMLAAGAYLCWFAVHYWASDTKWPTDPLKAVLTGKPIPTPQRDAANQALSGIASAAQASANAAGAARLAASGTASGIVGTSQIASAALKYQGAGYVWGGPADRPGDWDCSSFVSYVLGHDLGQPLPGGHWGDPGFPPHAHGPTTLTYMLFGTPVALDKLQSGDLVVSSEHMGVYLGNNQYISARTPASGTGVEAFDPATFPGGTPVGRRV